MFCKEYLCSCNARLRFDFKECSGDDTPIYAKLPSTITLVMTKKLMLSIRSSRYLIFLMFLCLSRFLVETKMNPFILFTEKGTAQRHFKPQMASSVVFSIFSSFRNLFIYCSYSKTIVKFFERPFWNCSSCDALKFFCLNSIVN